MPKQPKIRMRENDLAKLRKITKNYNAALARDRRKLIEAEQRYQAAMLPPKASVRELRKAIETRKDFNAELKRMQNYIDTRQRFIIDKNTMRSLETVERNFNAKIDRLFAKAKTQGERAALPQKISAKELIKNAPSKEALKKDISDYRGFLKRGAETLVELPGTKHNLKLTKWQVDTMDTRLQEVNAGRAKELEAWKETAVKYGGKEAGYTQGQVRMDQGDFDEFAPLGMYNFSSTYGDMRERFRLIMRQSKEGYWDARTELARINYTEKMDKIIGDHPIGKILLKHIKGLDLADFKRVLKGNDDLFLLLYELENHPENMSTLLETIWNEWKPKEDMNEAYDSYVERKARKL